MVEIKALLFIHNNEMLKKIKGVGDTVAVIEKKCCWVMQVKYLN